MYNLWTFIKTLRFKSACILTFLIFSCLNTVKADDFDYNDPRVRNFWYEFLTRRSIPQEKQVDFVKSTPLYDKYTFKFTEHTRKTKSVSIDFYLTHIGKHRRKPLVLLYPGMTGTTILDRSIAHVFNRKGYHVAVSHYFDTSLVGSTNDLSLNMLDTLRVGFSTLDYLIKIGKISKQVIDQTQIALFGTSFGAIRAAYQLALDQRIRASALIVGGFPLADIMTDSEIPYIEEIRHHHMEHEEIATLEEYRRILKQQALFKIEEFWKRRDNHDVFMVTAAKDSWVPTHTQEQMWQALGKPFRIRSKWGHVRTPICTRTKHIGKIARFFQQQFRNTKACHLSKLGLI
ncbi:MAG: prolyl oligopeptidase family serine peptidase [Zetaproteobacteria bacterium]|nr:prolyl oligopeptidase family serine peptidase [Zetaproteobacteria bacterium]